MSRRNPGSASELVFGEGADKRGGFVLAKDWLRAAVTENVALKAVAFLLALTLFILVHSDEDEIVPVTIKLTYAAPREGLTLVEDPPSTVRVAIKGSRRRLRRLVESELDPIQVTLTNTGEFVFHADMVRPLPEGIAVASISPASITLVYESTKDKTVAVRARTIGEVAPGYRVQSVFIDPAELDIRGAESALAKIDELVTLPVSIEGAAATVEMLVKLAVPPFPAQVVREPPLAPQDLIAKVVVEVVPSQGRVTLKDVAISLRAGEGLAGDVAGWMIEPTSVSIVLRGDELVLSALDADSVTARVTVFPADNAVRAPRNAAIEVLGVPAGVAVELSPEKAKLTFR